MPAVFAPLATPPARLHQTSPLDAGETLTQRLAALRRHEAQARAICERYQDRSAA